MDAAALFREVESRSIGMGVAEGRGGYPGGGAPGWADYVADQRAQLASFDALVAVHGPPNPGVTAYFQSLRRSLPDDVRLAGDGESAQVDSVAGRAFFTLVATPRGEGAGYAFPLNPELRDALCQDPALRARLAAAARAAIRVHELTGQRRFSELDFAALAARLRRQP